MVELEDGQETVTLQGAAPEAKHTDGETTASKKAKPTTDWERQSFLSEPWPHLAKLQLPLCGTHLTQRLHRAALDGKPQTACRGTTQSSWGGQTPDQTPQIPLPEKDVMIGSPPVSQCCWEATAVVWLASMTCSEEGASLFLPLSSPDNTLRKSCFPEKALVGCATSQT